MNLLHHRHALAISATVMRDKESARDTGIAIVAVAVVLMLAAVVGPTMLELMG